MQKTELNMQTTRWMGNMILLVAGVLQLTRIVQVQSATGEVPFHSANDRSRWCTIAALVVKGSYEIDDLIEIRDPTTRRRTWYTIDLVQHRGTDGKLHFYSSKPPLLPTLYAGVYYAVRGVTGATLMNAPFLVAPIILILVNLLPLLAFWWLMMRWIEQQNLGTWATVVTCLFLAWGTYLSTFVSTLNNHLPAAIAVGISLWCIDRIALQHDRRWRWFVLCGFAPSF
jgi:cytochrome c biogenesis factor